MYPLASKRQIGGLGQAGGGAGGISLPYTFDPSALSDGALPSVWEGGADTWQISGGVVVNTPTLGSELLTDGGLEVGPYPSGQCASLSVKAGTPTLAESGDAYEGSRAQSFIGNANNDLLAFPYVTSPTANQWYIFSCWLKRTAGTVGRTTPSISQSSGTPAVASYGIAANESSYAERQIAKRANSTNQFTVAPFMRLAGSDDTILGDACSLKQAVHSTLFKIVDTKSVNQVVKVRNSWNGKTGVSGCVAKCSQDKTSFLVAYYWLQSSTPYAYCVLEKCVAGTYTQLIATWSNGGGAGNGGMPTTSQDLEIRVSGTTVQLFHNDIQVGTDQTVSDAEITGNTYAGLFDTGGNSLNRFFVSAS